MSLKDYIEYSAVSERLGEAIRSDRLSHAYIIEGDSLSQKEDFAIDMTKAVLCKEEPGIGCDKCLTCRKIEHGNYQDLYIVESDNRSVKDKDVLQLQQDLMNVPTGEGERNIAVVLDADTMTVRAQNRFLKTLEEPQVGTLIMLLAENSEKLLPTIRSRCQTIRLFGEGAEASDDYAGVAASIIGMVKRKAYYIEIKERLETEAGDRRSAEELLDSMEHLARNAMLGGSNVMTKEEAIGIIPLVEETRKDIKINVNQKYAMGDLILKLEEVLW
ncbi:MAG: hypothetical protein J5928_00480 [Firmicutes bacterium]|nr:hypothetical protein [Bacillota bacterium]